MRNTLFRLAIRRPPPPPLALAAVSAPTAPAWASEGGRSPPPRLPSGLVWLATWAATATGHLFVSTLIGRRRVVKTWTKRHSPCRGDRGCVRGSGASVYRLVHIPVRHGGTRRRL